MRLIRLWRREQICEEYLLSFVILQLIQSHSGIVLQNTAVVRFQADYLRGKYYTCKTKQHAVAMHFRLLHGIPRFCKNLAFCSFQCCILAVLIPDASLDVLYSSVFRWQCFTLLLDLHN